MQSNVSPSSESMDFNLRNGFSVFVKHLLMEIQAPVSLFLLQIIIILVTCRIFAYIFIKTGQPTVIGEILAGIVLGPSILGSIAPGISAFLFKEDSLAMINMISTIGLVLFMFAIGMELDISEIRKKIKETILISHAGTIIPFAIGVLAAYYAYDKYADAGTPFLPFALFIGISMSITAFPVLARIIQERKLTRTHLGTLTLACAANGDITAWCLLALIVAIAQAGSVFSAMFNILFSIVYMLIMLYPIRRFLRKIGAYYNNEEVMDKWIVALIFLILTCSAYLTQALGLHALFGAFIAGLVMPENLKFRRIMTDKVEDVSLSLFLPLFFVSIGLRTEIALLNTPELWRMCLLITLGAIVGKAGGTFISARIAGETLKDSLYIGALMNTRGLMELVVLTIGYEMHILPPTIFVMLVIMTLVTTFMTAPLTSLIRLCFKRKDMSASTLHPQSEATFRLLLSFSKANSGQVLLDVAHQMFSKGEKKLEITALHLTVGADVNPLHAENYEEASFGPILYGAKKLNIPIVPRYEVTTDAGQEIVAIVNEEKADFLLVGAGGSISAPARRSPIAKRFAKYLPSLSTASESLLYPGALLRDKTKVFVENASCPVGIFINHNFVKATNIILLIVSPDDLFLLKYIPPLLKSTQGHVSVIRIESSPSPFRHEQITAFAALYPQAAISTHSRFAPELLHNCNFMLIGYKSWNALYDDHPSDTLRRIPSTLILSEGQG